MGPLVGLSQLDSFEVAWRWVAKEASPKDRGRLCCVDCSLIIFGSPRMATRGSYNLEGQGFRMLLHMGYTIWCYKGDRSTKNSFRPILISFMNK